MMKMIKKDLMMIKIKMDQIKIKNNKINHHNLQRKDDIMIDIYSCIIFPSIKYISISQYIHFNIQKNNIF